MIVVPYLIYLALIAIVWALVGSALPAIFRILRRMRSGVARWISEPGLTERMLSFLPESVLKLKPYAALLAIVIAGSLAAILIGELFIDLAQGLLEGNPVMEQIDQAVHGWAEEQRTGYLTTFYLTFSTLGDPLGLTTILLLGIALALLRREWSLAAYLALTSGIGALLNRLLKLYFGRERPDLFFALTDAAHESFPSGHTMGSAIILGALAYAALRLTPSWRLKSFWISVSLVTMLTIAASRIYLGVHWTTDIAAGFSAGFAWLLTSIVVYETYRRIGPRPEAAGAN
ncbi:MAG: phosphatase PAP2 family protein [Thermoanaerobaculia bacterium]|nr:phosphatase PAP2 family protein [Thermoanaerobaculia bacterium]